MLQPEFKLPLTVLAIVFLLMVPTYSSCTDLEEYSFLAIHAGADTYVESYGADRNFGDSRELVVSSSHISFIRFNVLDMPRKILQVILYLDLKHSSGVPPGGRTVGLHECTDEWNESLVTYENQPNYDRNPVATFETKKNPNSYKWNLTEFFNTPEAKRKDFISFAVVDESNVPLTLHFSSKESSGDSPPELAIDYHKITITTDTESAFTEDHSELTATKTSMKNLTTGWTWIILVSLIVYGIIQKKHL